jgi:hypothetical protein
MENSELLQHTQGIPVPPLLCYFAFGKAVNGYPGYNYIFTFKTQYPAACCGWDKGHINPT